MQFFELTPAYGRDYKSSKEVKAAWDAGNDFVGDYQLGFRYVAKPDIPRPCTVILRYKKNMSVTTVKVGGE